MNQLAGLSWRANETLYSIGGSSRNSHSLAFTTLSCMILEDAVRHAFCFRLGLSLQRSKGLQRKMLRRYTSTCL